MALFLEAAAVTAGTVIGAFTPLTLFLILWSLLLRLLEKKKPGE